VSLLLYLANGRVLPSNDAKANAYAPLNLLGTGEVVFAPTDMPYMFGWRIDRGDLVLLADWRAKPPGEESTYAELLAAGRLLPASYGLYLVPTLRTRAGTGEALFANTFGPAAGLTALPAALVAFPLLGLQVDHASIWLLAKITAALLVAGSVALVYLSAARFTTPHRAALLAAAYAFGTCVWSISSQTLWQQTPALFFYALGILCVVRGGAQWGAAAGAALALAMACRPTGALVLAAAAIYLLLTERRAFAAFVAASLPIVAALAFYNWYYFGAPWSFGQLAMAQHLAETKTGSPEAWQTPLWLGAAGLLLSPSRGLLIHSPFLLLAFAGAVLAWRRPQYRALRFVAAASVLLWIPAFLWFDWWGGWTYGYRPIVDTAPMLALLCLPVLDRVLDQRPARLAFAALLAWSVLVQVVGVFAYTPLAWNGRVLGDGTRADIDLPEHRHRLWSFRDWQIGFFIVNFPRAVAVGRAYAADWVTGPHNATGPDNLSLGK